MQKQTAQDMQIYETTMQMELRIRRERESMLKQIEDNRKEKLTQAEIDLK